MNVYAGVLGVDLPFRRPGAMAVIRTPRTGRVRKSPTATADFAIWLERIAVPRDTPFGLRYYASMFLLMTFASLRRCDTRGVSEFWITGTSVGGISNGHKSKSADLIVMAAPKGGCGPDALWLAPVSKFRRKAQPKSVAFVNLPPSLGADKELVSRRVSTRGTVQEVLTMFEATTGITSGFKLRSIARFLQTCEEKLRPPCENREESEKFGRWAPGSVMRDRYARAVCVTELRIRGDIVSRIAKGGWRPSTSFSAPPTDAVGHKAEKPPSQASDIPAQPGPPDASVESDAASST